MENQGIIALYFLSPAWLIILSIIAYFALQKPFDKLFGKINTHTVVPQGFFIFVQLLLVGLLLDSVTRTLGINDTAPVEAFAQTLSSQQLSGALQIVISALGEELFFRGIIFNVLGSIPSILIFGAAHAGYGSLVQLAGAFAAGFILIRAREQYGSIFPGLLGHALYNLAAVFVLL